MKKIIVGVLLFIIAASICTTCTVKNILFTQGCKGHLKRAADANTIEIAQKELTSALSYMNAHNLKTGYTSIIYKTPDEDVGFWYDNITASLNELNSLSADATPLEKSNMLIKLRETLLDDGGDSGTSVTYPQGIQRFPDNKFWAMLNSLQIICWLLLCSPFIWSDLFN